MSYAVEFANARGGSMGVWSKAIDVPVTRGCPQVTVPVDSSTGSLTTVRRVYRQIDQGPSVLVKVIPDNEAANSVFYDDSPGVNFRPPHAATLNADTEWAGIVTNQSKVWNTNGGGKKKANQVQYSVAFTFAPPAASVRENYPQAWLPTSMRSKSTTTSLISQYAYSTLSNVPVFPVGPDRKRSGVPSSVN